MHQARKLWRRGWESATLRGPEWPKRESWVKAFMLTPYDHGDLHWCRGSPNDKNYSLSKSFDLVSTCPTHYVAFLTAGGPRCQPAPARKADGVSSCAGRKW